MINRRAFMGTLGSLGVLASASLAEVPPQKRRIFVLEHYYLKNGTQPGRIHEYFSKTALPALAKLHAGPKLFLDAIVAPHMPQVAVITGFQSFEELWGIHPKLFTDKEFMKATDSWESHAEQPFEHCSVFLLEATDYCPEWVPDAEPRKKSRIFELRTYHSPTWKQLQALHERFAGPEIKIFHRVGVHPILYTSTLFGQNLPNLTYVIPFDSLAEREKAWDAFSADPEWIKVRKESIDRSGQISSVSQISLYRATAYSPIR
jgi:hypothetical protein